MQDVDAQELNDGNNENIAAENELKYSFSVENFDKNRAATWNQNDNLHAIYRK